MTSIDHAQLLATMYGTERLVDIQQDALWYLSKGCATEIDQRLPQAQQ
jgi:hypothetical protein